MEKKFGTLLEALHIVVQELNDDGDRLASIMTSPTWLSYNHPASIKAMHGPEWVRLFPLAVEAQKSADSLLADWFHQGKIEASGLHTENSKRGTITKEECERRYINIWKNRLEHEQLWTPVSQPWVTDVLASLDDVRAKCDEIITERKRAAMPPPSNSLAVLEGLLRAERKRTGRHVGGKKAKEIEAKRIAQEGGAFVPRAKIRKLLKTFQPERTRGRPPSS